MKEHYIRFLGGKGDTPVPCPSCYHVTQELKPIQERLEGRTALFEGDRSGRVQGYIVGKQLDLEIGLVSDICTVHHFSKVVDVDQEKKRRYDAALRNTGRDNCWIRHLTRERGEELESSITEKALDPSERLAFNLCIFCELVEQPFVPHTIKGFLNVEKDCGEAA
jgi:hypothetical protein